jgi:hypothetical protein
MAARKEQSVGDLNYVARHLTYADKSSLWICPSKCRLGIYLLVELLYGFDLFKLGHRPSAPRLLLDNVLLRDDGMTLTRILE